MNALEGIWWQRVPMALARLTPMLGAAAFDGAYFVSWRLVGALVPALALLLGLALGAVHPPDGGYTWTYSLLGTALLLAVSGFGSGIGFWLLLGYAIGDFVVFDHIGDEFISLRCAVDNCTFVDELLKIRVPALISYVILAQGLVLVPFAATALRGAALRLVARLREPGLLVGVVVQGLLQGLFAGLWVQSLPFAIRPLWSFFGDQPQAEAIVPMQEGVLVLAGVGAVAGAARVAAEFLAMKRPNGAAHFQQLASALAARPRGAGLPFPLGVVLGALLTAAVAAGLAGSLLEAGIMVAALIGIGLLRARLTRLVPTAGAVLSRVPIALRLLAAVVASYFVGRVILGFDESRAGLQFVLIGFLVTLLIFAVLTPELGETAKGQPKEAQA